MDMHTFSKISNIASNIANFTAQMDEAQIMVRASLIDTSLKILQPRSSQPPQNFSFTPV